MITDLRTGAFSGGGGEQARVMAASIQVAQHYGLCNSCIAAQQIVKSLMLKVVMKKELVF